RKILKGEFDDNIKAIFQSIAYNSDFDIDIMETDKDHIHFLISYPPKLSVTSIVRKLKQESTIFAWHLYGNMLRQYFWKEKTLWSDGYFVCSIGEANHNTIREYIRQITCKNKLFYLSLSQQMERISKYTKIWKKGSIYAPPSTDWLLGNRRVFRFRNTITNR